MEHIPEEMLITLKDFRTDTEVAYYTLTRAQIEKMQYLFDAHTGVEGSVFPLNIYEGTVLHDLLLQVLMDKYINNSIDNLLNG